MNKNNKKFIEIKVDEDDLYMNLLDELINEWKLTELKSFASELKITNRSKMNKNELAEAITEKVENA